MSLLLRVLLPFMLSPTAVANADMPVYGVDQLFRDNGIQFKVNGTYVAEDDYCGLIPRGMWLMPILNFKNVSDKPQRYNVRFQRLLDKNGRVVTPNLIPACGADYDHSVYTLLPGEEKSDQLAFDVPAGSAIADYTLEVHQSPSSTGALVRLKCGLPDNPELFYCP